MKTYIGSLIALLVVSSGFSAVGQAQESAVSPKAIAIAQALNLGLSPSARPYAGSGGAPFVRLIRKGGTQPLEVKACVKPEVVSGAGVVAVENGKPIQANPYSYVGLQLTLDRRTEYIEAGIGYVGRYPELGPFFQPYIRRAPDYEAIGKIQLPAGFVQVKRNGNPLPGYWVAKPEAAHVMAPDAEFCIEFRLDVVKNAYVANYAFTKNLEGAPVGPVRLEMPSARQLYGTSGRKIRAFEARLLTTVAMTRDKFDPADPLYKDLVYGARWEAQVFLPFSGLWQPFRSSTMQEVNADPSGNTIFFDL